ncbi:MAG: glycerophosphodiester phosphodiesterase [Alteromonas sp.]|jgi:glycerophosphoryl diester phosphodiesterase|uniref:glycerophosphodiester phosphodiesterase n=1 Tax=Alteromonas australica TaxID=589873 RepID=A0A075P4S7_9ALTE|nr:glycerophosphodiester phosphodiesterase [Alteromonas australica]AIF98317.1 glycerophosphodiester phosphodiesterase [Alteromonas australica]MAO31656.1 glycerophosphodiester phosphodiesterase [Alteromonas sp.]HBF71679.1 glycerophosphodiester phosphodiesterase [Alteromonas australica]|tara:strand:- start:7113 stop:8120 length:1008 start_codon:yes stop_codon:yes gene_type:complete
MSLTRYIFIGCSALVSSLSVAEPFDIIAHRGASGFLPEHTLEAATLAFAQRPDFIEQDVVITKDGVPVVLHDIHLETVTNVEDVYSDRARDDGRFYALDFTLAELKRLRVHERQNTDGSPVFPNRYQGTQAHFTIATLAEHIELITQLNRQFDTDIGIYPEIKSPAWHREQGVDISKIVLATLGDYGMTDKNANSYLQCFDFAEVKRLRDELGYQGNLVMLIADNSWGESATDYTYLRTEAGMAEVSKYADGIGPWLGQLLNTEALKAGKVEAQPWLAFAQQNKLIIHPYTFRKDALPPGFTSEQLLTTLKDILAVDGVFTDQVPTVKTWREKSN